MPKIYSHAQNYKQTKGTRKDQIKPNATSKHFNWKLGRSCDATVWSTFSIREFYTSRKYEILSSQSNRDELAEVFRGWPRLYELLTFGKHRPMPNQCSVGRDRGRTSRRASAGRVREDINRPLICVAVTLIALVDWSLSLWFLWLTDRGWSVSFVCRKDFLEFLFFVVDQLFLVSSALCLIFKDFY